jgi:hypothetical protein
MQLLDTYPPVRPVHRGSAAVQIDGSPTALRDGEQTHQWGYQLGCQLPRPQASNGDKGLVAGQPGLWRPASHPTGQQVLPGQAEHGRRGGVWLALRRSPIRSHQAPPGGPRRRARPRGEPAAAAPTSCRTGDRIGARAGVRIGARTKTRHPRPALKPQAGPRVAGPLPAAERCPTEW